MRKILSAVAAILMVFSLVGCNAPKEEPADPTPETQTLSYAGKSAAFVGDSITNGAMLNEGEQRYWQVLADKLQLGEVTGMGVNGSCYSTKSEFGLDHEPLATRYQKIPQADLIFIFLGTNDFGRSTPMGTIEDTEDISFYGAMNMILTQLETQCPDSQIILLTPIVRYDKSMNNLGLKQSAYIDAIKAVAAQRGLPLIDTYELTRQQLSEGLFADKVHPDQYGHQILAQALETWLQENIETILK